MSLLYISIVLVYFSKAQILKPAIIVRNEDNAVKSESVLFGFLNCDNSSNDNDAFQEKVSKYMDVTFENVVRTVKMQEAFTNFADRSNETIKNQGKVIEEIQGETISIKVQQNAAGSAILNMQEAFANYTSRNNEILAILEREIRDLKKENQELKWNLTHLENRTASEGVLY